MPIATFRGERTLGEIADKMFAKLSDRQRETAAAAILKANPQLAEIDKVRIGTVLRVPDIPELRPKTNRSLDNPVAQIAEDITAALRNYDTRLAARIEQAAADNKSQSDLLTSAEFKSALSNTPELQELAAQAVKTVDARNEVVLDRQKSVSTAIRRLTEDLNKESG